MFNLSFCQELSKQQPARRHPNFPSGTHGVLVGKVRLYSYMTFLYPV